MANNNNNTNELVDTDEDPTEELEVLVFDSDETEYADQSFETDVTDSHPCIVLNSDDSAEIVERLEAELDRMRVDSESLEKEVSAREKTIARLTKKLLRAEEALNDKDRLLTERDQAIKDMAQRERDAEPTGAAAHDDSLLRAELESARRQIERQTGRIAANEAELREQSAQLARTESYADTLRHELADKTSDSHSVDAEQALLAEELETVRTSLAETEALLASAREAEQAALAELARTRVRHEQEIKTLRFELGEAETSSAHYATTNERLLSDLMDARGFREELERMLSAQEQQNQARVEDFRQQVATLESAIAAYRDNLDSKGDAIKDLLEELVNRTSIGDADTAEEKRQPGSLAEKTESEGTPTLPPRRHAEDGMTRLLVGRLDQQELRFPLFKDNLTIGRTGDNDIQLKAPYISRRHAVICTDAGATRIIDWDSKNGVYVNKKRVTEHFLTSGDVVAIGDAEFRYEERSKRDA